MSINYDQKENLMYITCDLCQAEDSTGGHDWKDCWKHLKDSGWKAIKSFPEWVHQCPGCQKR